MTTNTQKRYIRCNCVSPYGYQCVKSKKHGGKHMVIEGKKVFYWRERNQNNGTHK